jgi:hypothetical protein
VVLVSSKIALLLQTLRPCGSGYISGGCRLGCALGPWKQQQICCGSSGSSIGSCGISCCGGSGSVGASAVGCTLTVGAARRCLVRAGGVLRLCPCGSCYALAAWASPSRLGFAHTQQSNSKAAAAKAALAALPLICHSGSGWWQQLWQQH